MSAEGARAELVYVSWGGTGRAAALREALNRAHDTDRGLVYLAILDDQTFGDIDTPMVDLVKDELEWLLDTQVELTRAQTGLDVPARVLVRAGPILDEVIEAVDAASGSEVLIGGPVSWAAGDSSGDAGDGRAVDGLLRQLRSRIAAPVSIVDA